MIKINCKSLESALFANNQILEKKYVEHNTLIRNFRNNIKLRTSIIYELPEVKKDENNKPNTFFEGIKRLGIIYLQFYLIFCILSLYRWYEELLKIKSHFIDMKFSHFEDLTKKETNLINPNSEYEGKYVFASGECKLIKPAQDNIFNFNYKRDYAVVERNVEYFDITNNTWSPLGYTNSKLKDSLNDLRDYYTFQEEFLQFSANQEIYTFPRIISSKFLGRVK